MVLPQSLNLINSVPWSRGDIERLAAAYLTGTRDNCVIMRSRPCLSCGLKSLALETIKAYSCTLVLCTQIQPDSTFDFSFNMSATKVDPFT